jgi:hypothetical protein
MNDAAEIPAYLGISRTKARYCRTLDTKDWADYGDGDSADVIWAMQDRVVWGKDRRPRMANSGHTGYGHYHNAMCVRATANGGLPSND